MVTFKVRGPFDVRPVKQKVGRRIGADQAKDFWMRNPELIAERGCYVFAFRASKGLKVMYIGKATTNFGQEVFSPHKLNKYADALGRQAKGTPILFFVCARKSKGKVNRSAIDDVESFLIQAGLQANKKLLNDKKTKVESWGIKGIVRGGKGKLSKSAKDLRQCLKLIN